MGKLDFYICLKEMLVALADLSATLLGCSEWCLVVSWASRFFSGPIKSQAHPVIFWSITEIFHPKM